ncbi:MAG: hypothetical protein IPM66_25025 [Acidobacteriota bacterium]|nr:MAG: hypothetical protein IPM66_25025 [Acidobacteriota bacterium]
MDRLHSLTLLAALVNGGLGAGATIVTRVLLAAGNKRVSRRLALIPVWCGALALLFGVVSAAVHFIFGHGQGGPEPMALAEFFLYHKAYWFVAALAAASFAGLLTHGKADTS